MKFILALFLFCLTFTVSAFNIRTNIEPENSTSVVTISGLYDRGQKGSRRNRKTRRVNKKRKKKCKQFGRKVYAG